MNHLQDLLGVQQLSRLRRAVVQSAIDALERKAQLRHPADGLRPRLIPALGRHTLTVAWW